MIIRIAFVLLAAGAISAATYAGYQGRGGESTDLDKSIRTGSGGAAFVGRVK